MIEVLKCWMQVVDVSSVLQARCSLPEPDSAALDGRGLAHEKKLWRPGDLLGSRRCCCSSAGAETTQTVEALSGREG